ncbi:inositol monophosphatase family protein [Nocardia sp. NPDC127526]|uniref:inositol monophosphatase family protein n=1 Tax=Nocardia sp. NPDC127526 TaxID=3345393 RepID=UPI00362FC765
MRIDGAITVAAVADPVAEEVFWTAGAGAFLRGDGHDQPLRPRPDSRLVDIDLDPPFPNLERFRAARLLDDDRFAAEFHPRVLSTSLALVWVAAGRRAAYLTDGAEFRDNVHFTSGIAICRAAGCTVTGLAGQPLHSTPGGLLAAADTSTHARLVELIGAQGLTADR